LANFLESFGAGRLLTQECRSGLVPIVLEAGALMNKGDPMTKITPCLWFDRNGEDAARFYVSVFKNSSIGEVSRYGENMPLPAGTALTVEFILDGKKFTALNGGPIFKFTEAVSFQIACKDQKDVDYYWEALTADRGEESQCGWLKDKFGLSWQVVPDIIAQVLSGPDKAKAGRVMQAMMPMKKIDVATLEKAAAS